MLFMKCPVCNDEYTVTPVRNKTGSFVCQACGWQGKGVYQWGTLFDDDKWLDVRQDIANILSRMFTSSGFPVEHLKGRVSCKDRVVLVKGRTEKEPVVVEYPMTGRGETLPEWLELDSAGRPRSMMQRFRAWLHDEGRDTLYICDSFRKAVLVMEAWWRNVEDLLMSGKATTLLEDLNSEVYSMVSIYPR